MPLNKNAIRVAQVLDLTGDQAEKFFNLMNLTDMAAITTAISSNDLKKIKEVFEKYKSQLNNLPSPLEVKKYYDEQLKINDDSDEALVATADFFGIKGEDVEKLMSLVKENTQKFIPDRRVSLAVKNVEEMSAGKQTRNIITELNTWQRRMFFGLIPPVTAKVIQDIIDMTPIAVMQKHAKIHGYGEPGIKESTLSLKHMIEKIIEDALQNLHNNTEDQEVLHLDSGTIEKQDLDDSDEVDVKIQELINKITKKKF